jgi:hypothetical protein
MRNKKKMRYKHIHFVVIPNSCGDFPYYYCKCFPNKGKRYEKKDLGLVEWMTKQWEYLASDNTGYSSKCLRDIADFMDQLENPQ